MTDRPVADKYEDAFLEWYGGMILDREARSAIHDGTVSINDDHHLLRLAFHAGWKYGADETLAMALRGLAHPGGH